MKNQSRRYVAGALLTFLVFTASTWHLLADADDQYSDWSAPVNLGPPVNWIFADVDPFISKNGLSLYFSCNNCPGGFGGFDLWVSHRSRAEDPWGLPQNLVALNTSANETNPVLSSDEHKMYFTSNRPGGFGATDLYVSRRHNKRDNLAWQPPENLGGSINTTANDRMATYLEDELTGVITLYFSSDRPGGLGGDDIYASTLQPDETFGPAVLVAELSSPFSEQHPAVRRRDGLEFFLVSNRPGSLLNPMGQPSFDLWVSTRASTLAPWSAPVNLGPVVNSPFHDGRASLSFDNTTLYFQAAQRVGNVTPAFDLWVTTRTKLQD
ncbi:MAG TPA: hypothetical protein VNN18_04525 [Candidatus Xenobia bacterium]|nr:hypothetical protein [Candidatus Xenobia bacterium]